MSLPARVRAAVEALGGGVRGVTAVGGGSVGAAARVETPSGALFVKWATGAARASFAAEADGLARLAAVAPADLVVPAVMAIGDDGATGWLVLPWLDAGRPDAAAWRRFGRALAALHAAAPDVEEPARPYGQPRDGWIGRKPQAAGLDADWARFFGERRLLAQAAVVRAHGAWEARWDVPLERLVRRLPEVIPARPPPATLHGDLWAGNALPLFDGRFALIDPAAYVGHAEADVAMTELFGGFAPAFSAGYREVAPGGDADARDVYNLYHLINHLTHGPGYAGAVDGVLRRYA